MTQAGREFSVNFRVSMHGKYDKKKNMKRKKAWETLSIYKKWSIYIVLKQRWIFYIKKTELLKIVHFLFFWGICEFLNIRNSSVFF